MALAIVATDSWIQHLQFMGPRPSDFGPIDGMFYGVVAGDGDASGGNVTLNGRLSFDRKEDWVYIVGGTHTRTNQLVGGDVFEQINTGPLIPTEATATTVSNPTFEYGGLSTAIGGNAVSFPAANNHEIVRGMPIFGDKRIPGIFLMYASGWEVNTDLATYVMSIWGFLIRYESFFRSVRKSVG